MEELFARVWENLIGRVSGPLTFRLILQPIMAVIFAIRAGLKRMFPRMVWMKV
jgi:hypothetical protein